MILWENIWNIPQKLMANYLRKKGWIAFYLDDRARECKGICWLKTYLDDLKRDGK